MSHLLPEFSIQPMKFPALNQGHHVASLIPFTLTMVMHGCMEAAIACLQHKISNRHTVLAAHSPSAHAASCLPAGPALHFPLHLPAWTDQGAWLPADQIHSCTPPSVWVSLALPMFRGMRPFDSSELLSGTYVLPTDVTVKVAEGSRDSCTLRSVGGAFTHTPRRISSSWRFASKGGSRPLVGAWREGGIGG